MTLRQQQFDTTIGKYPLLHGEALLIIATCDSDNIALQAVCVVCCVWCVVCGVLCVVCCVGVWCVVCDVWWWFVVCIRGVWCVVRGVLCVICYMWCCVWCGVWCGVWCVVCGVHVCMLG